MDVMGLESWKQRKTQESLEASVLKGVHGASSRDTQKPGLLDLQYNKRSGFTCAFQFNVYVRTWALFWMYHRSCEGMTVFL